MSVTTPKQQQSSTPSLDYRSCYVTELRHFLKSRTTLTAKEIRKLNKAKMVSRLKKLDTQRTFSLFMDLPPELRLNIYQRVLLINGEESGKNHSALLRVSRLVYSESEPVLYCGNSFHVQINPAAMNWTVSKSWESEWNLPQACRSNWRIYASLSPVKIDMLFGLRQLTLRLSDLIITRIRDGCHYRHGYYLGMSLANICLMLSSSTKLKTLTITNVPPQDSFWDINELTKLLFPLVFIRKPATIKVEGGTLALATALESSRRDVHSHSPGSFASYGILLFKAMDVLAKLRQQRVDSGTYSMLRVSLDGVLMMREGILSERDLRSLIARLGTLKSIVAKAEAILAMIA